MIAEAPAKEGITWTVQHLPMRKAPGPDRMTAELLKYRGQVTWSMTVKLITLDWQL